MHRHTSALRRRALLPLPVLALLLAGCTASAAPPEPVVLEGDAVTVGVHDDHFAPAHAVVAPGTTVTWEWDGRRPHDVVGEGFASSVQETGTFTETFDEPGTHEYVCRLHRGMVGVIEVRG
jgi:plastocyanin